MLLFVVYHIFYLYVISFQMELARKFFKDGRPFDLEGREKCCERIIFMIRKRKNIRVEYSRCYG